MTRRPGVSSSGSSLRPRGIRRRAGATARALFAGSARPAMTQQFRYRPARLAGDYLRGGFGLGGAALFWVLLPPAPQIHAVFGGLTLLFLLFTIRTVWRQIVRVEVSDDAITMVPPRRGPLAWRDIVRIELSYFSTRRNRKDGWMTLRTDRAGGAVSRSIPISTASSGSRGARRAAARSNGIELSDTTRANFARPRARAPLRTSSPMGRP